FSEDEIAVSGRASGEVHIDELLERCEAAFPEGIFLGYGGHARAGGFRVRAQDLELAVTELQEQARLHVEAAAVGSVLEIDAELPLGRLTIQAAQLVRTLAPFGAGFLEPIFLTREVVVMRLDSRGDGKHASFQVADGDSAARGIAFNADPDFFALRPGDRVDLVYHLQLNEWQGSLRPEMRLRDWRKCT
ncbi:MAG: hypothetical protein M3Y41_16430, partial [Pseudomonadota bacterium]|nr:hypothetical protein [Pseudomonadota bacterium]